jgi:hypothetical protein
MQSPLRLQTHDCLVLIYSQIEFILRHLRSSPGMIGAPAEDGIGLVSMERRRILLRLGQSRCPDLPHLEGKWLSSVRSFLSSIHGGSLELADPQIQSTQGQGDLYLMDLATPGLFNSRRIRGINLCWLFFNALLLLDISPPCDWYMHLSWYTRRDPTHKSKLAQQTESETTVPQHSRLDHLAEGSEAALPCWQLSWPLTCHSLSLHLAFLHLVLPSKITSTLTMTNKIFSGGTIR